jgi:acyl carrier protein
VARTQAELRRFIVDNFLYGRACRLRDDDSFLETGIIDSTGLLELVNFLAFDNLIWPHRDTHIWPHLY